MTRVTMWALLAVVASAAAVLSFSALRDLAVLCGFSERLAWLLPLVIDAGAATGCLAWLGQGAHSETDRTANTPRFARALTWVLLASSVAGNAVVHYLSAYQLRPSWWLVVLVSAVAPAVLGAVVHLAVLVLPTCTAAPELPTDGLDEPGEGNGPPDFWATAPYASTPRGRAAELLESGVGRRRLAAELGISEHQARQLLATRTQVASS